MPRSATRTRASDDGFTLVELLIVIVVLGVLATITVFAVRGITDQGEASACASELDVLQTAEESHYALNGSYADEATLVAAGTLVADSTMYDVTVAGDSYAITPVGACPTSGSGGGPPPPAAPPVPVVMPSSSFSWHGGVTAWRFGADTGGDDEIVVLGRDNGKADWVAATDAGASSTRRVHFIDIDSLTAGNLNSMLALINNNGDTALGVYQADDTTPLPGSAEATVYDHLLGIIGTYPRTTLYPMNGGTTLQSLFAAAP
jgi:general secretion pathway protein G